MRNVSSGLPESNPVLNASIPISEVAPRVSPQATGIFTAPSASTNTVSTRPNSLSRLPQQPVLPSSPTNFTRLNQPPAIFDSSLILSRLRTKTRTETSSTLPVRFLPFSVSSISDWFWDLARFSFLVLTITRYKPFVYINTTLHKLLQHGLIGWGFFYLASSASGVAKGR